MFKLEPSELDAPGFDQKLIGELTVSQFRALMTQILNERERKEPQPRNQVPGLSAYDRERLGLNNDPAKMDNNPLSMNFKYRYPEDR